MLSMESTATRANRLGKSVVTDTELLSLDEVIESLEAVTADDVASLAAELLPHERLSVAGIGGSERRFRKAVARVSPALADAGGVIAGSTCRGVEVGSDPARPARAPCR